MKTSTAIALAFNAVILSVMAQTAFSAIDNSTFETDYSSLVDLPPMIVVDPATLYLAQLDTEELNCLALNVYFEARNQSVAGQKAVAWVTLNRVENEQFPTSICEVVWQNRQFSWTHDGKNDTPGGDILEDAAWELAQEIAAEVLVDKFENKYDLTQGATHFHADYADPYWTEHYSQVTAIDNHVFYK